MRTWRSSSFFFPVLAVSSIAALGACGTGGGAPGPTTRTTGQTNFVSAPPAGQSNGGSKFGGTTNGAAQGGGGSGGAAPAAPAQANPRTVQETDLYRLDGNRLYYLNAYRGLLVFDVTNADQPKFLGRSPIFGSPVDMVVNNGIAVVVVGDWYGVMQNGQPFHGSIVRGLDATDPTNIKVVGEAQLGGWVQDDRVVGNVLYAVSEDYGWTYDWGFWGYGFEGGGVAGGGVATPAGGYGGGYYGGSGNPDVVITSVNFANGQIQQVSSKRYAGYGGVFNVTPNSIMLAHPTPAASPNQDPPATSVLQYLDISDPNGAIVERGAITVDGSIQSWAADDGRWNLDFADGVHAHIIGCAGAYAYSCGGTQGGYVMDTADFTNPDKPTLSSELQIPATGWDIAARFDGGGSRMYLSPSSDYYSPNSTTTPLQIYTISNPTAPVLSGQTNIPGNVWIMIPSGDQLFALGQQYGNGYDSSSVSLNYLDVTNAASPKLLGTSTFGNGWAWTPAADTFKAFTMDPTRGYVVLPFSGWDSTSGQYNNGVQLIQYTPTSIATAGAAHTHGWVERGIFVNNRIVSLSDLALSTVDYSNSATPQVTAELTLARNVVAAKPGGTTVAEVSSDWWGNDDTHSEVHVLPVTDAAENSDESGAPSVNVNGVDARVYNNGSLSYMVTAVPVQAPCNYGYPGGPGTTMCTVYQEQVQVVDLSNNGATLRGSIALPLDPAGWYWYWGWYGFWWYDWYDGSEIVQAAPDALAFRRWHPNYNAQGQYIDASSDLYVVDLSNPDAPQIASVVVTTDPNGWWGNMKVVGSTLYVNHYEWQDYGSQYGNVRYYLDPIDLSDRSNPKIGSRINVPGLLVGGSSTDPSILYTIDYRWVDTSTDNGYAVNDFDVLKLDSGLAYLQSTTTLDGWVGNVFVRDNTAWMSAEQYFTFNQNTTPLIELHQIDLTNPSAPVDSVATQGGWGWLLDVEGDRALVTSGWGEDGMDIYKLSPGAAPQYDQFVRTRGWWVDSVSRQDNQLFLSSGYWGVEPIQLQ